MYKLEYSLANIELAIAKNVDGKLKKNKVNLIK